MCPDCFKGRNRKISTKHKILHISSTTKGGGVAEILSRMIKYEDIGWLVPYESAEIEEHKLGEFYNTTKKFHNLLQGHGDPLNDYDITIYEEINKIVWDFVKDRIHDYSSIVVDDPQPAYIIPKIKEMYPDKPLIWRCHIDLSKPDSKAWEYMKQFVDFADVSIFHTEEFIPENLKSIAVIMPPSIDPTAYKNCELKDIPEDFKEKIISLYKSEHFLNLKKQLEEKGVVSSELEAAGKRVEKLDINASIDSLVKEIHGIKEDDKYMIQVSRYDKFKDPIGVVKAYVEFCKRRKLGDKVPYFIYAAELVDDDPEGVHIFKELTEFVECCEKEIPGISKNIKLLIMPNWDKESNAVEINVLQRSSMFILQKSIAEGFALTVSEAMWKGKAVIGGNVGGIKKQLIKDLNGILVDSDAEAAEAMDRLATNPDLNSSMGLVGKEVVRRRYILPVHLENYKLIVNSVSDKDMLNWMKEKKNIDILELNQKNRMQIFFKKIDNSSKINTEGVKK